jgi:hypothetical protein
MDQTKLCAIILLGAVSSASVNSWAQQAQPYVEITPNIVSPSRLPDKPGTKMRITFAYSSEGTYEDIDITDGILTYTTITETYLIPFSLRSCPAYQHKDLSTRRATLNNEVLANISDLLRDPEFLSLPEYTGTGPNYREYLSVITVFLGKKKRRITYGSNPSGPPMPPSFRKMRQLLIDTARQATDWHEPKHANPVQQTR